MKGKIKMRKTKEQKGITLVALIITIVVLLILAIVSINAIQNGGIISKAETTVDKFDAEKTKEELTLQEYEDLFTELDGGFKAYKIEDEVTVNGESFYVIADSDETEGKVTLLAKICINTKTLEQSSSADMIEFSSTAYWTSTATSYPYDLIEEGKPDSTHYAAYAAYQYGVKMGGTGRLMTYSEASALVGEYRDMIQGSDSASGYLDYWLSRAWSSTDTMCVYGNSVIRKLYLYIGLLCTSSCRNL